MPQSVQYEGFFPLKWRQLDIILKMAHKEVRLYLNTLKRGEMVTLLQFKTSKFITEGSGSHFRGVQQEEDQHL